jgi:hypothetical protein
MDETPPTRHAVFKSRAYRVTPWMDWGSAVDAHEKLDSERPKDVPLRDLYYEVRSSDDPKYNRLPLFERRTYVHLDRPERETLLAVGRTAGGLDDAADAMFTRLLADERFADLEAVELSDYAYSAAGFCFPHERRNR